MVFSCTNQDVAENGSSAGPSSQSAVVGELRSLGKVSSQYVNARQVDVWLPSNYDSTQKYAVLYMHDGQMLFDSTKTWNGQEWGIDETMDRLMAEGQIQDCIVVGVWNDGEFRSADYFPQKAIDKVPAEIREPLVDSRLNKSPRADGYLKFLVEELKPIIDERFSTYTDVSRTFVAGSSMGGLISMYAFCEYPEVFGGAVCLSTHWPGAVSKEERFEEIPQAILEYLEENLPEAGTNKIYFDYGTATLDSLYEPYQLQADNIMKAKGYDSNNWLTLKFEGDAHTERAWQARMPKPLEFLLGKKS